MKFHQLQYFASVAEQGSVRKAAQALGLSPTAVSKAIIELEDELETALMSRQSQGVELTDAGRTLLAHAKLVRRAMNKAEKDMRAVKERGVTRLAIGVPPWLATSVLPLVLSRFLALRADVKLEIQEIRGVDYAALRCGTLDLAMGLRPKMMVPDLDSHTLFHYGSSVVCRPGHPLAAARTLSDLQEQWWTLSRDAYEIESPYDELFGPSDSKSTPLVHVIRSTLLSMTMVQTSDVLSVVPWPLLESPWLRDTLQAIDIAPPLANRQISLITRKNNVLSFTARQFLECFVDTIGDASSSADPNIRRVVKTMTLNAEIHQLINDLP